MAEQAEGIKVSGMTAEERAQKKEEEKQKILEKIAQERDENLSLQRFGYFSIPYPAVVGDQAYSQNKQYENHKIIDGKVVIEKRGIYTKPPKSGKGWDAYFAPIEPLSDQQVEEIKQHRKEEYEALMQKVKDRREAKAGNVFKPGGPQEMFSYYKNAEHPESTGTLTIEPNKQRFILPGGKVKTENRGIFTNPTKLGTALNPNDYFQYYRSFEEMDNRLKSMAEQDIKDKLAKVQERKENKAGKAQFKPASLKRCEPFAPNTEAYGVYTDEEKKQRLDEYREYKKHGNPKYVKTSPKGAVKHDKPFQPARLVWQGRDGLFNDDLYKLPEPTEKDKVKVISVRERKEAEAAAAKSKRMPFTYNKLMKHSTFSPSISSFKTNLKREFPSIRFH